MQRLALVTLALVAAFLLGRVTAPDGAASQKRTMLEASPGGPRNLPHARSRSTEENERRDSASASSAQPPATPSAALALDSSATTPFELPRQGRGEIEIHRHESVQKLELMARNMRGEWTEVSIENGGGTHIAHAEVAAGRYELRVKIRQEPGPRTYRLVVEPGKTIVVDLAATPTPDLFPLAPGLGRIDIEVTDAYGNSLPDVEVVIEGWSDTIQAHARRSGRVRFDVMPGEYQLKVGPLRKAVSVTAGRTYAIHFDGRATGEIEIAGAMYRSAWIQPLDGQHPPENTRGLDLVTRYVLLEPGRYGIHCWRRLPSEQIQLATVHVTPGRRVRVTPKPPGVFVRFEFRHSERGPVFQIQGRIESSSGETYGPTRLTLYAILFRPGSYTVSVDDKFWEAAPVRFDAKGKEVVVRVPVRARPNGEQLAPSARKKR